MQKPLGKQLLWRNPYEKGMYAGNHRRTQTFLVQLGGSIISIRVHYCHIGTKKTHIGASRSHCVPQENILPPKGVVAGASFDLLFIGGALFQQKAWVKDELPSTEQRC